MIYGFPLLFAFSGAGFFIYRNKKENEQKFITTILQYLDSNKDVNSKPISVIYDKRFMYIENI